MPAPARNSWRISVEEGLQELERLKLGLAEVSYSEVFERMKQWKVLFFRMDFATATSPEQASEWEKQYRSMRELLQWRIDQLQIPAQDEVVKFKTKLQSGALEETDLQAGLAAIDKVSAYEFGDKEDYIKDLKFLVSREFTKLKYGEGSQEYGKYKRAAEEAEKAWQEHETKKQVQIAALKKAKGEEVGENG